ncbi:MAG: sulfide/dihydroorotate dehydrogenase-like FAD/NAD-binding protein, partial [Candidatus Heimdallarchaeota archaeon]|nr:sulfide/dihydroorotate dehydrogenase-like FAD/NAD-binding protein [Candidatus Heimdallarchaeota archaeon]
MSSAWRMARMYEIVDKKDLNAENVMFKVKAPQIASSCKAGQFIIVRANEKAERIPLTIADWDSEEGWIKIIFQKVGASTYELADYNKGEEFMDFVGPLGIPTHAEGAGKTVVIGGGLGIAIATPVARAYKQAGNHVDVIIGARNSELLILEKELEKIADNLY